MSDKRELWICLAVATAIVALQSFVLLRYEQFFDSDQAVYGLMAKHLSEFRTFPLFFYGQNYMLGVQSWLAVSSAVPREKISRFTAASRRSRRQRLSAADSVVRNEGNDRSDTVMMWSRGRIPSTSTPSRFRSKIMNQTLSAPSRSTASRIAGYARTALPISLSSISSIRRGGADTAGITRARTRSTMDRTAHRGIPTQ